MIMEFLLILHVRIRNKSIKVYVPPRFELGSQDSESWVLTITPWDPCGGHLRFKCLKWVSYSSGDTDRNFSLGLIPIEVVNLGCLRVYSGGSKGGRRGRAPSPGGPNSFNFMQFLGKIDKFVCWRPPWELAPPPRGNPGSATGVNTLSVKWRVKRQGPIGTIATLWRSPWRLAMHSNGTLTLDAPLDARCVLALKVCCALS